MSLFTFKMMKKKILILLNDILLKWYICYIFCTVSISYRSYFNYTSYRENRRIGRLIICIEAKFWRNSMSKNRLIDRHAFYKMFKYPNSVSSFFTCFFTRMLPLLQSSRSICRSYGSFYYNTLTDNLRVMYIYTIYISRCNANLLYLLSSQGTSAGRRCTKIFITKASRARQIDISRVRTCACQR